MCTSPSRLPPKVSQQVACGSLLVLFVATDALSSRMPLSASSKPIWPRYCYPIPPPRPLSVAWLAAGGTLNRHRFDSFGEAQRHALKSVSGGSLTVHGLTRDRRPAHRFCVAGGLQEPLLREAARKRTAPPELWPTDLRPKTAAVAQPPSPVHVSATISATPYRATMLPGNTKMGARLPWGSRMLLAAALVAVLRCGKSELSGHALRAV